MRERPHMILWQAAIGAGLCVGLPAAILVEARKAAVCPDPERAVRATCERTHFIVWQAAIGAGRRVGLPAAILVEARKAGLCPDPERAVRATCERGHASVRQLTVFRREASPDRDRCR